MQTSMPSAVLSKLDKEGKTELYKQLMIIEDKRMADQYQKISNAKAENNANLGEKKVLSFAEKHIKNV